MRVLVTGASGFIGRAVVAHLLATGHEPRVLTHTTSGPDGVEAVHGDLLDRAAVARAAADVDAVVHLAAVGRVRESFEQPLRYYDLNVTGTLNVLAARPERLVFASTGTVYAPAAHPLTEDDPRAPANPYSASKAAAEDAVAWAARAGLVGAATLRLFNAAGGGDPDTTRVVTRAVEAAAGRVGALTVFGDGSAVRDFVHVRDIASAAVLALGHIDVGHHDVFNIGATAASVRDVVAAVERVTGRPVPLAHAPAHEGEVPVLRADTSRAREVLGWRPRHSALDDLVRDQWLSRAWGPGSAGGP